MKILSNCRSCYQLSAILFTIFFATHSQQALGDMQPHESIYRNVRQFVKQEYIGEDISITVGKLDVRLKLPLCSDILTVFWPQDHKKAGNTTVGVRCQQQIPWKIYLAVNIKIYKQIAIAKHTLKRGDILKLSDINWERRDISGLHQGYLDAIDSFIGQVTTRVIAIRQPIIAQALAPPTLIKRGENVIILAKSGGIEVRVSGEALSDGALGDMIKIRNRTTDRVIAGKVVAKGVAQIHL